MKKAVCMFAMFVLLLCMHGSLAYADYYCRYYSNYPSVPGVEQEEEDFVRYFRMEFSIAQGFPTYTGSVPYTVTLDANGGTVDSTVLETTLKWTYRFSKWNDQRNGNGKDYTPNQYINYDTDRIWIFYAQWSGSYTVYPVTLPMPTRDGYIFRGWAEDSTASSGIIGSYTPSGNVTLHAIWAEDNGTLGDIQWQINNDVLTISGQGDMGSLNNDDVWRIFRSYISSIVVESGVTSIGNNAFSSFYNLTDVTLPEGLTTIGSAAFANCPLLAAVTLPQSLTQIGDEAFRDCPELVEITVPDALTEIGAMAFNNCTSLKSFPFPEGLKKIGHTAFHNTGLERALLPDSVTEIDTAAFSQCSALSEVRLSTGLTYLSVSLFMECHALTEVTVPEGVTEIRASAFNYCRNLETITLPRSLELIGDRAIMYEYSLNAVYYGGTQAQWQTVAVGNENTSLEAARMYYAPGYTLSYNANGGSGAPGLQYGLEGETLLLSEKIPVRQAYTFLGWAADAEASEAAYQPGDSFSAAEDITLYAVWIKSAYIVSYHANGGDFYGPNPDIKEPKKTLTLSSHKPVRDGYVFLGWATAPDSQTIAYQPESKYTTDADADLYAVWTPGTNSYTIKYSAGAGNYAEPKDFPIQQVKVENEDLYLSDLVPYYSSGAFTSCTIFLSANGGTLPTDFYYRPYSNSVQASGQIVNTFQFWTTNSDGTGTRYNPGDLYTDNKSATLYAQWHSVTTMRPERLPVPTREGYTFLFWGKSFSATSGYTDTYTPAGSGSVTLYAIWEKDRYYTVIFDANGGESAPAAQQKKNRETLAISSAVPTREGWYFLGWAESPDAVTASYLPGDSFTSDADTRLYAIWGRPDLVFPSALTQIDEQAFSGASFTFAALPDHAVTIGSHAFEGCAKLAYIYIPDGTILDPNAFYGIPDLLIIGGSDETIKTFAAEHGFRYYSIAG